MVGSSTAAETGEWLEVGTRRGGVAGRHWCDGGYHDLGDRRRRRQRHTHVADGLRNRQRQRHRPSQHHHRGSELCRVGRRSIRHLHKRRRRVGTTAITSIPAADWTPELRAQYEEVGRALRSAADQAVPLVKLTPHRVVRELYEQFIAYARAYSDAIPTYTPVDQHLVGVAGASCITCWCIYVTAITYDSAQARAPVGCGTCSTLRSSRRRPTPTILSGSSHLLIQLVTEWDRLLNQFDADSVGLAERSILAIPASEWSR